MIATRSLLRLSSVVLAAASLSCGLFETRDPQEPDRPSTDCRPLTSTLNVRANVEDTYGRDDLTTCYNSMVGDSFLFHPDPQDSLQNPGAFIGWNNQVEIDANARIASLQTFIQVDSLATAEYKAHLEPDPNTEVRFLKYLLRVRGLVEGDTTIARYTGLADITFRRGTDGQWRMIDWADHRGVESDSTWGLLRSNNRVAVP